MVDKKSQHRLRIVLDASKAHRCKWCGSSQSDWWITEKSGVYCSQDCVRASHSEALGCYLLITFFYTILMIWAWPAVSQDLGWFYLLTFILLAIIPLSLYRNRRYALKIPKGSRNHIGVSEVSLLRKLSAPIQCPNCDATIDLSKISEDMIYTCQYCGANGILEIDILEWIQVLIRSFYLYALCQLLSSFLQTFSSYNTAKKQEFLDRHRYTL